MDESGAPVQNLGQPQQPQQQGNPLSSIMGQQQQPQQPPQISKNQVIAALHHFSAVQKQFMPLMKNPDLGKANIRPKIFDAAVALIGEGINTVPETMNGIKDLPSDPVGQKKWLEKLMMNTEMAQKKIISDYIGQGPGQEPDGPAWSMDTHKDHMNSLMSSYKR